MDIENEIVEQEPVQEEVVNEQPQSLREQIQSAAQEVKEAQEPKETLEDKPKIERPKDDKGKFVKVAEKTDQEIKPESEVPAPKSYGKAVLDAWATLPKEIKNDLAKREQDFHRELTKHDEERTTGRQFKEAFTPYMAQIRAEGGDPLFFVQNSLNIAHILRTGTPQQKAKLLLDTAAQFGVDITQAQQGQPKVDPVTNQLLQKVQQLEGTLQNQQQTVKQQNEQKLVELVNTFVADTANYPHFSAVESEMMALLNGGMFKDEAPADRLKKVYDYAVHANPQTRSTLISQGQEKRVADQKAKAEAARKAGSSVKGKPGMLAAPSQKIGGSLREQLRDSYREAREA